MVSCDEGMQNGRHAEPRADIVANASFILDTIQVSIVILETDLLNEYYVL